MDLTLPLAPPSPTRRGRGEPVATRAGTSLAYIQPDHLGSATTVTDSSGQVIARERYSSFGERRRGETPTTTAYLYTDQRYSAFVGFYHYSSGGPGRHYDPLLGRFLQADPVTPSGSQGLNRYGISERRLNEFANYSTLTSLVSGHLHSLRGRGHATALPVPVPGPVNSDSRPPRSFLHYRPRAVLESICPS